MTITEQRTAGVFLKDIGGLPPVRGLVHASQPTIPKLQNGQAQGQTNLAEVMPPFASGGVRSVARLSPSQDTDLASRVLFNDPRDLWYLSLPSKLTPSQVLMIFRAALGGDLWQQWQLQKLMSDTWVMFRKCAHELRSSVAAVRYTVHPYCEPGKQPSASAKIKAECVARGMMAWRPNQFTDEKGLGGFIYHSLDSVLSGVSLCEIQWQMVKGEILPRAATWVHPRQFTFSNGGHIAIWDMNFKAMVSPDPNKFTVMQYLSDSGSALGCGLVRPLGWYWSGLIFNREWMLKSGQKYGGGFLKMYYPDGATEDEIKKLSDFADSSINRGWILLRKDMEDAEFTPPANLGPDNPQRAMIEEANEAAQLLLLGQTATTQGNKGSSGINNNNNAVQMGVLTARKEELATNVSEGPLTQLAMAICRVNYDGDDTECPKIVADMTQPLTAQEKGMVITALNTSKAPMVLADYYELTGTQPPSDGQQVIIPSTGEIGLIGDMDEPLSVMKAPEPEPAPQPKLDENNNPIPPKTPEQAHGLPPWKQVEASYGDESHRRAVMTSGHDVKLLLASASDDEVRNLSRLVLRAIESPHKNGEVLEVQAELNRLIRK